MAQHVLDSRGNRGAEGIGEFSEAVMDPHTFPPRFNEPRRSQIREWRDTLGWETFRLSLNVADAHFPVQKQTQNSEPRHIAEGFKERFESF